METNPSSESYKILRSQHVVFVLRERDGGSEFIALQGNTTDEEAVQVAGSIPPDEWRIVKTINFDSIESKAMPKPEKRSE